MRYRQAEKADIPQMAHIRAKTWGTQDYWEKRISGYLSGEIHPQQALMPRVSYVAVHGDSVVGFIAGHLTRRYACEGELEWIDVNPEHRRTGVASDLIRLLATWFTEHRASKICVNVAPENKVATKFYMRHGADRLNEHWLQWNDIGRIVGNG
jgi:ribosomal protein S18 acetylase RimI-like enzyme